LLITVLLFVEQVLHTRQAQWPVQREASRRETHDPGAQQHEAEVAQDVEQVRRLLPGTELTAAAEAAAVDAQPVSPRT
jgi:hypothetical protein